MRPSAAFEVGYENPSQFNRECSASSESPQCAMYRHCERLCYREIIAMLRRGSLNGLPDLTGIIVGTNPTPRFRVHSVEVSNPDDPWLRRSSLRALSFSLWTQIRLEFFPLDMIEIQATAVILQWPMITDAVAAIKLLQPGIGGTNGPEKKRYPVG
jgi:hypothetical protein